MKIEFSNKITVEEYFYMRKSAGWYVPEKKQAEKSLENSLCIVTARDNGEIVGMARLVGDGAFYTLLVDVVVIPQYQGNGIGKNMVERILEFAKSMREENQIISVQLSSAKGKESFYEQFGFVKRPNETAGSGMGIILCDEK